MPKEFDVRQHVLVPKHEVLSEGEARELLERYKIASHQLPLIKASDPAAKAVGAKPGDIVKITRRSPTAGRAIAYRCVVEG